MKYYFDITTQHSHPFRYDSACVRRETIERLWFNFFEDAVHAQREAVKVNPPSSISNVTAV